MLRLFVFAFVILCFYSAAEDSVALSPKQRIPPTIYYPDGSTYTLKPNEVIHIAQEGDTVYTKEEGDDTITFIVNYPNKKRDFNFEIDECSFGGCDDPGE
jgi:hypothetical protein